MRCKSIQECINRATKEGVLNAQTLKNELKDYFAHEFALYETTNIELMEHLIKLHEQLFKE